VGPAGVVGGSTEGRSSAGSTTTGGSITGAAAGGTEKAGDFADRDDRRRDFLGAATSTGTSWGWSTFGSLETSTGSVESSTPLEGSTVSPCNFA